MTKKFCNFFNTGETQALNVFHRCRSGRTPHINRRLFLFINVISCVKSYWHWLWWYGSWSVLEFTKHNTQLEKRWWWTNAKCYDGDLLSSQVSMERCQLLRYFRVSHVWYNRHVELHGLRLFCWFPVRVLIALTIEYL